MAALTLRLTVIAGETRPDDYCVRFEGRNIGRIRCATERAGFSDRPWDWRINPPLPIPTWCVGQATSIEDAKAAFREAWDRFHGSLTPRDIDHWHHHLDAAA